MFKVIGNNLTTIFNRVQDITTGVNLSTDSVNRYVDVFNKLNAKQAFGHGWEQFLNGMNLQNGNMASYFEDLAKQGASARASIEGVYAAILDGNTRGIGNVKSVIATFNSLNPANQKAFATAVGQTNVQLGNYLTNLQGSNASLKGYTFQLVATTAKTLALKAASIALNMALTTGISWLINKGIQAWQDFYQSQEELRESARETANIINDQTNEMKQLVSQYEAILDSEKTESEKTEELNEWKQNLAETYSIEKDRLADVNLEREKGIQLLKDEIALKNYDERSNWLGTNSKQFEIAKGKINDTNYSIKTDGKISYSILNPVNTNEIRDSVKNLFDNIFNPSGADGAYTFEVAGDNLIEKYENIQKIITKLGSSKNLTKSEQKLLDDLNKESENIKKVLDDYQDIYETGYKYLAENNFDDFAKDNPLDNVGKENYLSWRKGLLDTAQGDKELSSELETLIENQFPDLTKYFENLDKAYGMFGIDNIINDANEGMKKAFINALSDEDLEIATKIPDLFADGLEGATKKIEAWKKQNPIETEVKITIDDALEGQVNKIKAITSAMEDMSETGYITSETYAELAKLGGNFTDCLEWENGKLKLNVDKLKDLEIQQLATAKSANSLAISELELKAASLAAHGQDFSDIQAQIESLMKENAVYTQLMEEIANAKPDDKSSSEKSEEPESVTQFKKALAEKEHLLNTNQISEQDYYEWLDSESKRVYGNLADYEEDLWKYEEQVYKWRQEQEQDLFDKKIENYKKLSDNALEKYVDGNGNELTVNASFDYARSQINSAIVETQKRINELSLKTGFEDEIDELKSDLDDLYDTLDDINKQEIESQKEYIQTLKDEYSDLMDEQIDQQKKLADEIEKSYENRISAIDKQIDGLNKVSEAEERQKSILEAEKDVKEAMLELDKAKTQKRLVYSLGGTWQLKEDTSAVKEAQDNLAEKQEALDEAKQDEQIAKLEEQKELLETQKDNSKEYYDKVVEDLESQKEAREKQYDILVDIYEQLGGDKKQTSLNESLVAKLTSNGDINKAVQGLTPTELQKAFTSGVLTTDSNGNYAIDYSILGKNEQAVTENTAELEKLNNQLSGKRDTVDNNTPTYNNKNLDAEGYLIGTDGKRVLHDGKPIHAKNFSDEIAKHNTSKKMTDVVKGIGKFAGYDTMQDLINAMITGEYTIPKAQLSNFIGSTISPKISQNIPHMGEYMTNAVNNTAPPINFTVNVDGSADEKTIERMKTEISNTLIDYTNYMASSMSTAMFRQKNKS